MTNRLITWAEMNWEIRVAFERVFNVMNRPVCLRNRTLERVTNGWWR